MDSYSFPASPIDSLCFSLIIPDSLRFSLNQIGFSVVLMNSNGISLILIESYCLALFRIDSRGFSMNLIGSHCVLWILIGSSLIPIDIEAMLIHEDQ